MKWMQAGTLVLLIAWSGAAQAELIYEGTREIGLAGLIDLETEDDSLVYLDLTWGQFVRDYWLIGVLGGFSVSESLAQIRAGIFTEYNIEIGSSVLPFVGFSASMLGADVDLDQVGGPTGEEAAFGLGGELGLKGFLADYVALSGSFEFQWATDYMFLEGDGASETDLRFKLGLRFYY